MIKALSETSVGMTSGDYKERFRAEYDQLCYRLDRLDTLLDQYNAGKLTFTPTCPYDLLAAQSDIMHEYKGILEDRAEIEEIDLV